MSNLISMLDVFFGCAGVGGGVGGDGVGGGVGGTGVGGGVGGSTPLQQSRAWPGQK